MHLICPQCQNPMELAEARGQEQILCPACGSSFKLERGATEAWSPRDGTRRLGRFELLEAVGTGSFGTVYKARDPQLGRIVAIKVPRAAHLATREDMDRFLREARSVAQLRHPGIVPVHEVGHADDVPYLVSDFVEGVTLDDQLTARRPAPREAAQLLAAVADALQYAHERGVVHRDVKPSNIMLGADGVPRLMDFGLAKREAGEVTMTLEGQVLGTPAYMSPEQAKGEAHRVDGRADVYSLGVILYQLLTGELPFRGNSRMLLHQVLHDDPRRPRSLNDRVPRDLETICLKALAKEPARRYASAGAFADDLRRFLQGEPIHARPVGYVERWWHWCRRNPVVAGLAAGVATLLLAAAVGATVAALQFRRLAHDTDQANQNLETSLYFHRIALAHRELTAILPNPGRAEELLAACPLDHHDWEWHYLKRLWRVEPVILPDPGEKEVNSVAFSPDGEYLAAACGDGTVKVWHRKTGQVVTTLRGHDMYVFSVAFSPTDGRRLASASGDRTVRVWDWTTRQEVFRLPGHEGAMFGAASSLTFSPDGRWLAAGSEGGTVKIWDTTTGQPLRTLRGHEMNVNSVAFSHDGRLLASGTWRGTVRIWDVQTDQILLTLAEHTDPFGGLAFSPDGRHLAAGNFDRLIDVWDTTTGERLRTLRGHTGLVLGVAFTADGRRLISTGGDDMTVRVWDTTSYQEVLTLRGHTDQCQSVAFSPDTRLLASGSWDKTIRLWDATPLTGNEGQEVLTFPEHTNEVWAVANSPAGTRIASAGLDKTVRVWDATTGRVIHTHREITGIVFSVAFSPEGHLAASGRDSVGAFVVKVWDARTGQEALTLHEPWEVFFIRFSPDGRWLALGLGDGTVKLRDARTGQKIVPVGKHDRMVWRVTFRPDGRRLASASYDGTVKVWDVTQAQQSLRGWRAWLPVLGLWPQAGGSVPLPLAALGQLQLASWLETTLLQPVLTLPSLGSLSLSVAFSPEGDRLVTGRNDGQLTLWDADTGREIRTFQGHVSGQILSVAFSPNGRWVASAGDDCTVKVWEATTMKLMRTFRGHLGCIRGMAISPDGKFLVTGSMDKTVKVWDLTVLDGKGNR